MSKHSRSTARRSERISMPTQAKLDEINNEEITRFWKAYAVLTKRCSKISTDLRICESIEDLNVLIDAVEQNQHMLDEFYIAVRNNTSTDACFQDISTANEDINSRLSKLRNVAAEMQTVFVTFNREDIPAAHPTQSKQSSRSQSASIRSHLQADVQKIEARLDIARSESELKQLALSNEEKLHEAKLLALANEAHLERKRQEVEDKRLREQLLHIQLELCLNESGSLDSTTQTASSIVENMSYSARFLAAKYNVSSDSHIMRQPTLEVNSSGNTSKT